MNKTKIVFAGHDLKFAKINYGLFREYGNV